MNTTRICVSLMCLSQFAVGCTDRYPPPSEVRKAKEFFEEHRAGLVNLVDAVQQAGYDRVALLPPDRVRVNDSWPPIAGKDKDMFLRLFSNAGVKNVVSANGCYTIAGAFVAHPTVEGDVLFAAPCRTREMLTPCSELENPIPLHGMCEVPLSAGWALLYQWFTPK